MISFNEVLGTHEVKTHRFVRSTIAELLGTCMLVVVGCGSVSTLKSGGTPDTLAVAFAFGLVVSMVIWLFGHLSGAHINPSISIAFLVTGHISLLKCIIYVLAQIVGGIAGAAILWFVLPENWRGMIGSSVLGKGVSDWQGVILEMIGTFLLVMTVFASCDRLRTDHSGSIALAIGFSVTAQIAWLGNITGASLNPARSLGPAVFSGAWDNHWVYWTGPISGGILAAFVYEHVFAEKTRETDREIHHVQYNNCNIKSNGFLDYVIEIEPPTSSKTENDTSKYNTGPNNSEDIINLEGKLDKEQIFLTAYYPLDNSENTSTVDLSVNGDADGDTENSSMQATTSNL